MSKKLPVFLLIVSIFLLGYIFFSKYNKEVNNSVSTTVSTTTLTDFVSTPPDNSAKTFTFNNFHGSTNISDKFYFFYPSVWFNDGQYFSPQKIEYYDLYSVKAPFYFDLILAEIFNDTEFKYQIDQSKRKSPDSRGKIDGKEFKKYDLIDYGSYGGESAGRVIIYVGPKITIDGKEYYLVFHWEERPLTSIILGNDPAIFEKVVLSLKFFK